MRKKLKTPNSLSYTFLPVILALNLALSGACRTLYAYEFLATPSASGAIQDILAGSLGFDAPVKQEYDDERILTVNRDHNKKIQQSKKSLAAVLKGLKDLSDPHLFAKMLIQLREYYTAIGRNSYTKAEDAAARFDGLLGIGVADHQVNEDARAEYRKRQALIGSFARFKGILEQYGSVSLDILALPIAGYTINPLRFSMDEKKRIESITGSRLVAFAKKADSEREILRVFKVLTILNDYLEARKKNDTDAMRLANTRLKSEILLMSSNRDAARLLNPRGADAGNRETNIIRALADSVEMEGVQALDEVQKILVAKLIDDVRLPLNMRSTNRIDNVEPVTSREIKTAKYEQAFRLSRQQDDRQRPRTFHGELMRVSRNLSAVINAEPGINANEEAVLELVLQTNNGIITKVIHVSKGAGQPAIENRHIIRELKELFKSSNLKRHGVVSINLLRVVHTRSPLDKMTSHAGDLLDKAELLDHANREGLPPILAVQTDMVGDWTQDINDDTMIMMREHGPIVFSRENIDKLGLTEKVVKHKAVEASIWLDYVESLPETVEQIRNGYVEEKRHRAEAIEQYAQYTESFAEKHHPSLLFLIVSFFEEERGRIDSGRRSGPQFLENFLRERYLKRGMKFPSNLDISFINRLMDFAGPRAGSDILKTAAHKRLNEMIDQQVQNDVRNGVLYLETFMSGLSRADAEQMVNAVVSDSHNAYQQVVRSNAKLFSRHSNPSLQVMSDIFVQAGSDGVELVERKIGRSTAAQNLSQLVMSRIMNYHAIRELLKRYITGEIDIRHLEHPEGIVAVLLANVSRPTPDHVYHLSEAIIVHHIGGMRDRARVLPAMRRQVQLAGAQAL